MTDKYPNWNRQDWPWAKGSWGCHDLPKRNEITPLWYSGGIQITSADFIFPKSKYEGIPISEMVRNHPKALELHMLHSNIYIFPYVIKHLDINQTQRKRLIRAVESYLTFDEITASAPFLHSRTYESNYDGLTLVQIINIDSQYLPYVIKHANGRLMIDCDYLKELIDKTSSNKIESVLQKCLELIEDILEEQQYEEERYQSEIAYLEEQEELRYWQNEGYRAAFDDNPDAEWNID